MLLDRVDPWLDFLHGDPLHRILLLQIPNYLPLLYVLLAPLGLLPFSLAKAAWLVCNLGFAVGSVLLACRFFGLRAGMRLLALGLFLMATCVRDTLGNGQQGLLVLFIWCLSLLSPTLTRGRAAVAGLSYAKFSFAPPLALYLYCKAGVRTALWSGVVPAVATVLVWLWLPGGHGLRPLLRFAWEPFQVASAGFLLRGADTNLADVLDPLFRRAGLGLAAADRWELLLGTVVCAAVFVFSMVRCRQSTVQYHVALLALASFLLFRHHNYDQVVLLLPLCYALSRFRRAEAKLVLVLLACPWYGQQLAERLHLYWRYLFVPQFFLLVTAGVLLYRLRDSTGPAAASETSQY